MNYQFSYRIRQKGVVLFIALIALVVMSLAAVALIRSVDTNTVISGNLAFKQSAVVAADRGAEAAFDWLDSVAAAGNLASLNSNIVAQGYHATIPDLRESAGTWTENNLDDQAVLIDSATWTNADSVAVSALASDGNSMRYIIQRMCLRAESPDVSPPHCLFGAKPQPPSIGGDELYGVELDPGLVGSPMYRVTVRVTGPKNTVSYTQAYAY